MKTKSLIITIAALSIPALALAEGEGKKGKHCEKHRERMLEQYDTDGDGELSDDEKEAAKADREARRDAFIAKHDTDGDGELSDEEKEAAKEDFLETYDTDGDGELSADERQLARDAGEHIPGEGKRCKGKKGGKGKKSSDEETSE